MAYSFPRKSQKPKAEPVIYFRRFCSSRHSIYVVRARPKKSSQWLCMKIQLHGGVSKFEGFFTFFFYEIDFNWRNHGNLFVNLVYYLKVAMEMCQMIWLGQSTNLLYQFKFFVFFILFFFFALPVWKIMVYSLRSIIFSTALKSILFVVVCIVRPMMIFEKPNQFVIEDWSVFMNFLILSFSSLFSILEPVILTDHCGIHKIFGIYPTQTMYDVRYCCIRYLCC